jgi:glyoxylase I family protein
MSAITIRDLDHVVLRTAQPDTMVRFYTEVLGCPVERSLDIGLVQLRAGRSMIDIVPSDSELGRRGGNAPDAGARNMDHFCVRIEPFDEPAIRAQLRQHGIDADETSVRYGAEGNGPSIYIKDPDGNTVELKGPPTENGARAGQS